MTDRPDLAVLARALVKQTTHDGFWECFKALRDAVLSEPAAEADGAQEERSMAWVRERLVELEALRAQLAAKPSNERWQELLATERAMLAAAPLLEAAHEYAVADALFIVHGGWRSASARVGAMRKLAKEAGELAKKEHGK